MSNERQSLAGTWPARATSWDLGMSDNGKEQIEIVFQILEGPFQGKSIHAFLYFTEGALDRTLESMRHCGWASDSLAEIDDLGNNEVEIVIEEEEYQGKWRDKVKWVNRRGRLLMKNPMSQSQKAAFAARLRGKTVASKQKYGAQPASTAAAPRANGQQRSFDDPHASEREWSAPADDDHIPF